MTSTGIPSIARTLKIRKKASFIKDKAASEGENLAINVTLPSISLTKTVNTSFEKARQSWLTKNS